MLRYVRRMATVEENARRREDPEAADSGQITTAVRGPGPGPAKASRLPGIDMIRVSLTWGVLLFHTSVAYCPSDNSDYYISARFDSSNNVLYYLQQIPRAIAGFMDVWQMAMFFFLSGVSAFHALKRRSEREFRKERVHRLLVPYLVLVLTNGVYSITVLAPHSPGNMTFSESLLLRYVGFNNAGQGWFVLTLFIFSQVNRTYINCMLVFFSQNSLQQYFEIYKNLFLGICQILHLVASSPHPCLDLFQCKEKLPSKVCQPDHVATWRNVQTWLSAATVAFSFFSVKVRDLTT